MAGCCLRPFAKFNQYPVPEFSHFCCVTEQVNAIKKVIVSVDNHNALLFKLDKKKLGLSALVSRL